MNILLIGGTGTFINNLIIKLNKEGHRLYLLTGDRYKQSPYQKVFERYDFTYDSPCLNEIFESVNPDLTLYMGAFDTNYRWHEEEKEAVRFSTNLTNILMSYALNSNGRFVYLSSHEVYSGDYENNIWEEEPCTPSGCRSMVLAQAEQLCDTYRTFQNKDVVTLRIDHLYSIPNSRKEINNVCARMCLEVLEDKQITMTEGNCFSMMYETDAVEFIYRLINLKDHKYGVYNISSATAISEYDVAEMVREAMKEEVEIVSTNEYGVRRVLDNQLFESEFGNPYCCDMYAIIEKMAEYMKKNSYVFLTGEGAKMPFWKRVAEKSSWFIKAMVPFLEALVGFVVFYFLDKYLGEGSIFSRLDFFLVYVLLFAIVYGQQQATFSTVLAVIGYFISQLGDKTSFELMLDSKTYIWIAQLFIFGLTIGYMRDQLNTIKQENIEEKEFLAEQLSDIQDINSSNVRVKDALEIQIVNQNDSVGKIYGITSNLEQYNPEEVLFYAVDVVRKIMKSEDVSIYTVSNADYARLFSYTSEKAKCLGNSIRYREMGDVYQTLLEKKVYINRKMDERYPLMANAIYANDSIKMFIFLWGIPWEHMTLGQSNQLTIVSALIQNAVLRANKYLVALETQRYVEDSRVLQTEAFTTLARAYKQAQLKGYTECILLKVLVEPERYLEAGKVLSSKLRFTDSIGTTENGDLCVLLANTNMKDIHYVTNRFAEAGYETVIMEDEVE